MKPGLWFHYQPRQQAASGCLRLRRTPDGAIRKYNPRLVAKGFQHDAGFDFYEGFSPVVKPTTIQIILTVALSKGQTTRQLDVSNAFLNNDLKEEVFMEQPSVLKISSS